MPASPPSFRPSSPWWCALHLPLLALDAEARHRRALQAFDDALPWALTDGPQQRRIHAANAAARVQGVQAGQAVASAQLLCPGLALSAHQPVRDAALREWLAAYAYGFSAEVSLRECDTVLFEAGRSLGLFGPWPRWQQRLRDELAGYGVQVRIACAPTPLAARGLARAHDGLAVADATQLQRLLARLPLGLAGLPDDALRLLERSGFKRLGDVLALPRAALAKRIGPSVLDRLDRLVGRAPDPLPLYEPPTRYAARLDFDHPLADATVLVFPLRRLLQEFALFLVQRDGGVPGFRLVFGHEDGVAPTRLEVRLAAPERDAARLFDLARLKLDSARLPAPAVSLGLEADDLPGFHPEHRDLFDARTRSGDAGLLDSRLRARLGDAAVQALAVVDTHRPEAAWCWVDTPRTRLPALAEGPRPLWLIDPPIVLREVVEAVLAGPERIETAWWDDEPVRRDYYRLRTRSGQEAWAFRPVGGEGGPWWLHGWFA
ncbi:Y-family DNA polymerase [Silanimonas sp.]|jgi:protein ImuB|uniref:Y-family DNA polymerase n=1 Tax=Silanimonas sp. TaxID=1929290 RepID=UPI0037CBF534